MMKYPISQAIFKLADIFSSHDSIYIYLKYVENSNYILSNWFIDHFRIILSVKQR